MKVFETYKNILESARGAVVAIGNFDGAHIGHAWLLKKAKEIAKTKNAPMAVLTFEPHPRAVLRPDDPPARITPFDLKRARLADNGVEIIYSLEFNWDMASIPAQEFIDEILIKGIGASHVVVGSDFRFGQLRCGTPDMIRACGVDVDALDKLDCSGGQNISASRIRTLLRHGKIDEANKLLGWKWEITGKVIHGDKRGRELGFPTANVALDGCVHPSYGVYAGQVMIKGERDWRTAALNIGIRPMFASRQAQAEAHILDWEGDIYGQILRIRPLYRLRGEARFESIDELIAQIKLDCAQARKIIT